MHTVSKFLSICIGYLHIIFDYLLEVVLLVILHLICGILHLISGIFNFFTGGKNQCKYLSEYFSLLLDFARLGEAESAFLLNVGAITSCVGFFMGHKVTGDGYVEILSDEEEEEEEVSYKVKVSLGHLVTRSLGHKVRSAAKIPDASSPSKIVDIRCSSYIII